MKITARDITICGIFAALTVLLAQMAIPIGVVPVSFAIFGVMLAGAVLTPGQAFGSQLTYIVLGVCGLPVFAGLTGGFQKLAGPTGGYLLAYPVMALGIAYLILGFDLALRRHKKLRAYKTLCYFAFMLAAVALCYVMGTSWFVIVTGTSFSKALAVTVYPFIIWDILKAAAAAVVGIIIRSRLAIRNI